MANFIDFDNAYSDPSTYAVGDIGDYPDFTLSPAAKTPSIPTFNIFANFWDAIEYPGLMADPFTAPMVPESHMPVATSNLSQSGHHLQPPYIGGFSTEVQTQPQPPNSWNFLSEVQVPPQPQIPYPWNFLPEVPVQPQPDNSSGWDNSFAITTTPGAPSVAPPPVDFPLGNFGENGNGLTTDTLHPNVLTDYRIGPIRTKPIHTTRSQLPYEPYHARYSEHINAEAGPSNLPPRIPSVGPTTSQPSGGHSETMADAEKNNQTTEEEEAPRPKRTKAPRGSGPPRKNRKKTQDKTPKLRRWAQRVMGNPDIPSLNEALAVAAKKIRWEVYERPHFETAEQPKELGRCSAAAMTERKRRRVERGLCQTLSQYYRYPLERGKWKRAELLSAIIEDVETHPALLKIASKSDSAPEASTPRDVVFDSQ